MTIAMYNREGKFLRQITVPAEFSVLDETVRYGLSYFRCLKRVGTGAAIFGEVA